MKGIIIGKEHKSIFSARKWMYNRSLEFHLGFKHKKLCQMAMEMGSQECWLLLTAVEEHALVGPNKSVPYPPSAGLIQ